MADFDAKSPAIELLDLVWRKSQKGKLDSYRILNGAMQDALRLVIYSGFEFYERDFNYINEHFNFGFWGGADNGGFAEGYYTRAVYYSNISACQAFEFWKKRKPYITDEVSLDSSSHSSSSSHKRGRLAIGSEFDWKGERVTITSFADGDSHIVACSYTSREYDKDRGYFNGGHKVKHIYKITHKDLKSLKAIKV